MVALGYKKIKVLITHLKFQAFNQAYGMAQANNTTLHLRQK